MFVLFVMMQVYTHTQSGPLRVGLMEPATTFVILPIGKLLGIKHQEGWTCSAEPGLPAYLCANDLVLCLPVSTFCRENGVEHKIMTAMSLGIASIVTVAISLNPINGLTLQLFVNKRKVRLLGVALVTDLTDRLASVTLVLYYLMG